MIAAQAISVLITSEHFGDAKYFVYFLLGQSLFILRRASMVMRGGSNSIRTRRQYLYLNWDILLYRGSLEWSLMWAYRHWTEVGGIVNSILHLSLYVGNLPQWGFVYFLGGMFSDSMLDWALTSKKIPDRFKEDIPETK